MIVSSFDYSFPCWTSTPLLFPTGATGLFPVDSSSRGDLKCVRRALNVVLFLNVGGTILPILSGVLEFQEARLGDAVQ